MSIFGHVFSTEYSNEEAYGSVKNYIEIAANQAKESGEIEPALILADRFSTAAQIPFFKTCMDKGVKPVFGLKVTVQGKDGSEDHELVLIAKGETGRQNLNRITTEAYKVSYEKKYKVITREQLEIYKDGLICVSGGINGLIEKEVIADNYNSAKRVAGYLKKVFNDNFYLQIQRISNDESGQNNENKILEAFKNISKELNIKIVATNDVRFAKKDTYRLHLAKKAIIEKDLMYNPSKRATESSNQYLLPTSHMLELFKDIPEAIYNMGDLIDSTDMSDFKNRLGKAALPKFKIPEDFNEDPVAYLKHLSLEGFENRWKKIEKSYMNILGSNDAKGNLVTEEFIAKTKTEYEDRILFELDVITKTGFPGYFLIVHELVNWCKSNDIPVGPGRGSGAGSLVLYCLNITNVNPIPYDLLFERFLNPERMSEPDIDIDFSPKNRGRVIKHMRELYGEANTAQILTEGTLAAKSVLDSVGRIRGLSPLERLKIKSLIPKNPEATVKTEIESNEKLLALYNNSRLVRRIVDESLELEGSVTSYGKHAGGVVVSLGDMAQYAALYREDPSKKKKKEEVEEENNSNDMGEDLDEEVDLYDLSDNSPVVQMDKDLCEKIGLIKFDILGLKNLDLIYDCVCAINAGRSPEYRLDIDDIDDNDPKVIQLFKNADTFGIFQFESPGMRLLMKDLDPDSLAEIIALVALFRPGPLMSNMHTDFIERKFNPSKLVYFHPALEKTLFETKGTVIYQEQVMSIARELADYSLGRADILRKAMGKKDAVIMAQQRTQFIAGCANKFRGETLENTTKKLKAPYDPSKTMPIDVDFSNCTYEPIINIVKDFEFKLTKVDQIVQVLKDYAGITEEEAKIFSLEVDNLDDKTFYNRYYQKFLTNGVDKLKNDGLSIEDATDLMARVAISSSIFVRFNKIFSLMDKFASYGFNKSHSVAYALVSWQTAYLKVYYPSQYMASMLSNDSNIERLAITLSETRRMGIKILPPDINESFGDFRALSNKSEEKQIRYGLDQVKSINKTISHLISIREEKGPVKDIFEFYDKFGTFKIKEDVPQLDGSVKVSSKTLIGKTTLNILINSGTLDSICPNKDPKYRPTLQATYHYLVEVVGDISKRLKFNLSEISKKLKINHSSKEINDLFESLIGKEKPENVLFPENISEMNIDLINTVYEKIREAVDSRATKKTEYLTLKEVHDYHSEIENFSPAVKKDKDVTVIKKVKIEQNGKELTFIEPNSINYADIPEYGTKESAAAEYKYTGMFQTQNPLDLGNIKAVLVEKGLKCSNSRDLPQEISTFGQLNDKTGKRYWQAQFAGTVISVKDFKRFNNETGESYMDITVVLDDGLGTVNVKFKGENIFNAGKEDSGLKLLASMKQSDVLIVEGSASNASYESAGVTIFPKKIGSANPNIYLPVIDPSLNFSSNENEKLIQSKKSEDLASVAQVKKIEGLFKKNNVAYKDIFEKYSIDNLDQLKKHEASDLIQKYIDKPSP